MTEFLEILKYTLPALVVFATAYFLIRTFFDNELRKLKEEKKDESLAAAIPLRFQAYERIVLFLERISPQNMVLRISRSGMSKEMLQGELLRTVREEYEHNLAQQIYLSATAWEYVKTAKEEVLSDINSAAAEMKEKDSATDYGQMLISLHLKRKTRATDTAIAFIKEEIREMF